ncbi:hypothetical protein [Agromyces sp. SYSU T00194]|uniref:hypothetical protein n=1 Tax=Agromyces chitinivorans TaxID=3158560 RepID=UPI003392DB7C
MTDEPMNAPTPGPTRRTVASAMAWSVPAVAVAASAPAQAASGTMPMVRVGTPCKVPLPEYIPGCPAQVINGIFDADTSLGFAFPIQIVNTTGQDIVFRPSIQITNVRDGFGEASTRAPFDVLGTLPDYCTVIEPGQTENVIVYAESVNGTADVYFDLTVPWGHDCVDHHPPVSLFDLYVSGFALCSSLIPFPEGDPTCVPPFYQS